MGWMSVAYEDTMVGSLFSVLYELTFSERMAPLP